MGQGNQLFRGREVPCPGLRLCVDTGAAEHSETIGGAVKLLLDFENWDTYVVDRDKKRVALAVRLQPESIDGWTAAAEAMGVPRTQVLNIVGMALHDAIVIGAPTPKRHESYDDEA